MTRIIQHILLAAAILAGLALAWELRLAILVVLMSVAVAAGLQGPIDSLTQRRVPHSPAVLGVFLLTLGILGGLIALATPHALHELETLANDSRDHYARHVEESPESPLIRLVEGSGPVPGVVEETPEVESPITLLSAAWIATSGVMLAGTYIALILVIAFYWLFDRARFERVWLSLLSTKNRPGARATWRAIEREVGAYVRSEVVQGVLAGLLLWAGLRYLGHPYPTLAALLGAVAWSVPWFGTLITMVLVGAMAGVGRPPDATQWITWQMIAPVVFTMGVLLFLEWFIERRIFKRGSYNSLLIAVVSIAMAELYGIWWVLLGPPLAVVIQIAAAQLWLPETAPTEPGPETVAVRVDTLRTEMAGAPEVPADLANLVERLASLVEGHRDRLPTAQLPR